MNVSIFLVLLSSILLILSFPNSEISWFVWVSFIPFLFAIENKNWKQTFWLSYLFGFVFWAGTIYWINFVTVSGCIFLILYLSIYFGIFGFGFFLPAFAERHVCKDVDKCEKGIRQRLVAYMIQRLSARHGGPARKIGILPENVKMTRLLNRGTSLFLSILFLSSFWVILEFIRSYLFTGFSWALLGYSQYKILPLIQIADITGVYGISFLIVFVNVSIFYIIKLILGYGNRKTNFGEDFFSSVICFLLSVFCIVGVLIYGQNRIDYLNSRDFSSLKVSVVQGNFPADEKWGGDFKYSILNEYLNLTYMASLDNPDLIVWPETSVPDYIDENHWMKDSIEKCAVDIKVSILVGAAWKDIETNKFYNSAVYFSKTGKTKERYDKIHLVPFGEYFPFAKYFPFVYDVFESGNFTAGDKFTIFNLNENKFNTLICYEDIFPRLVRKFIKKGSNFIVNISEDSWYKKSGEVSQHLQALVFRAVENRVSAVRVANTGISGYISPIGEVYGKVKSDAGEEIFISGYNTESIKIVDIDTFYQKYGDIFVYFCFLVFFILIFV